MCGIAGWVDWQRDLRRDLAVVQAMTATMACRGPDAGGVWLSEHAAIGHRRLAVIDVEGGAQPMRAARHGSESVISYSGEVYNFRELRRELQGSGHRFDTRSDTEVALRAYVQWGAGCVRRLNGMYAFAVWDGADRELILVRDRLGVKPLYYHAYPGGLLFGSEPKALIANDLFSPQLDDEGLADLFALFGTHTPGNAVFRGLREVPPGCLVRVGEQGVWTSRYWQMSAIPHREGVRRTVATVRELLADTVERQLVADVPVGVLVSGGLDSSVIAAFASRSLEGCGRRLATFSVDFRGSEADFTGDDHRPERDAPYVAALVDQLGTAHTDVVVDTPDLLASQRVATAARDLPALGDLDGSLYLLFRAIGERSTVALSGESADEVFGGYGWFHDPAALGRHGFPWAPPGAGLAHVLAPELRERIQPERYVADRYGEALAEVPLLDGETPRERRMREVAYLALTRFLPVLLDRKDRLSMAVGLEVRVPFCDHRLVEYLWNTPWQMKAAGGRPKALLRAAAADLLSPHLVERPKSMYPVATDPAYDRAIRARVRRLLTGESVIGPVLDGPRVMELVRGASRQPPWMQRLALAYLVQVNAWMRRYGVGVTATV